MKRIGSINVLSNIVEAERKNVKNKKARLAFSPKIMTDVMVALDDTITLRDFDTYTEEVDRQTLGSVLLSNA